MSTTYAAMRNNIRTEIKDRRLSDPVFSTPEIDRVLIRKLQMYTGESPGLTPTWTAAANTLTAGSTEVVFGNTSEDAVISEVRLNDQLQPLARGTEAQAEWMKQGTTTPPRGRPSFYWLRQNTLGETVIVFNTAADQNYTVSCMSVSIPPDDTSLTIDQGQYLIRAIECAVAASLLAKSTPEQRAKLGVGEDAAKEFSAEAARMLALDKAHAARLRRQPFIAPAVW